MKAVYLSQYRKKGTGALMFVYVVTGAVKELEEYINIQENGPAGKGPGTWQKADNGAPLWWLNVDTEKRNGNMPKQSYTLIFNRDKTGIIRDDSAEQLASYARINAKKEDKLAELQAEIELGLREVPTRGGAFRATATGNIVAPEEKPAGEPKNLADEIVAGIGEGEPGAGTGENLGD